jgi:glycosyltransferase A (GT-A) superfamily protein (DUF2064 family)
MSHETALIVMAKAPIAGRAKTRLSPPCTPAECAALAGAALADTLKIASVVEARRRVLAWSGPVPGTLPEGWHLVPQAGVGLDERIAAAFDAAGYPALLIGMDTPQCDPVVLSLGMCALEAGEADAVMGRTCDGGFWSLGLRRAAPEALVGVPMSSTVTGAIQRRRLEMAGLSVLDLPPLRDVDFYADALAVAAEAPHSRFAAALNEVDAGRRSRSA